MTPRGCRSPPACSSRNTETDFIFHTLKVYASDIFYSRIGHNLLKYGSIGYWVDIFFIFSVCSMDLKLGFTKNCLLPVLEAKI